MTFFRVDPVEAYKSAEAALAQTEARIVELEGERAAKLLSPNYAGEVDALDRQIEAQRRAAVVHCDRIAAMAEKQRAEERARLEREKADKIADMRKRLARRDTAAERLETALEAVRELTAELTAIDEAIFPDGGYLSTSSLYLLCRRDRRPSDPASRLVIGPVRSIADGAGEGLADAVKEKGVALIETMEAEPIEADQADEEIAA
jgi:predicted RNase H-like nuclease (RuvC/YqgF family)